MWLRSIKYLINIRNPILIKGVILERDICTKKSIGNYKQYTIFDLNLFECISFNENWFAGERSTHSQVENSNVVCIVAYIHIQGRIRIRKMIVFKCKIVCQRGINRNRLIINLLVSRILNIYTHTTSSSSLEYITQS